MPASPTTSIRLLSEARSSGGPETFAEAAGVAFCVIQREAIATIATVAAAASNFIPMRRHVGFSVREANPGGEAALFKVIISPESNLERLARISSSKASGLRGRSSRFFD